MTYIKRLGIGPMLALFAASASLSTAWAASAWRIVASPSPGSQSAFSGITAVSATDIWAVGNTEPGAHYQTLVEHYDGSSWSVVPSPAVANVNSALYSVSAVSPKNIWATGSSYASRYAQQTLVVHWDGATWAIAASPNPSAPRSRLAGVVAISAGNVWAVGDARSRTGSTEAPLIEHYDGSAWSISSTPVANGGLNSVAATSAGDIWAVGLNGLAMHYNGSRWSVVGTPTPAGATAWTLYSAAAINSSNIWATGDSYDSSGHIHTLVEHYDGATWSIVASPDLGTQFNYLAAVGASSAQDVWAVGQAYGPQSSYVSLTEHYDGHSWSIVGSANVAGSNTELHGVAVITSGNLWAAGDSRTSVDNAITLLEHRG